MKLLLLGLAALAVFFPALYTIAGWWLGARVRHAEDKADRILLRALRRTDLIQGIAALAAVAALLRLRPALGTFLFTAVAFILPFFWVWAIVAGSSWLELVARGLEVPLSRFHRFNLFVSFLRYGQRIPLFSAAVTAPAAFSGGWDLAAGIALHFALALLVGFCVRRAVLAWLVEIRPFPDRPLSEEIRALAAGLGVRLRGLRLVRTERGQAVNALAATSSGTVYVAEGLREGLERDELRAVVLHEVGHLTQRFTNLLLNLSFLGLPAVLWAVRALLAERLPPAAVVLSLAALVLLLLLGKGIVDLAARGAERRADAFAERHGTPGALRSALVKMYGWSLLPSSGRKRRRFSHPALRERLRRI